MLDASRRHLGIRTELVSKPLDLLLRIFENATSFLLAFEINLEKWALDHEVLSTRPAKRRSKSKLEHDG